MKKIIFLITFFIYSGYYAVLAIVIAIGMMDDSRLITVPLRLLTTALMLYVILKLFWQNHIANQKKIIYLLFILFWVFYIIKVLLHYSSGEPLFRNWYEYIFYAFSFSILPFFTFSLVDFKKYQKQLLNVLIFSGFVMGLISLYLYRDILPLGLSRINMIKYEDPGQETLSPLALSYAGALTIALSVYQLFFNAEKVNFTYKIYLYVTIFLAFIMFFLGASRGSVVALLLCIPIFLVYSKGLKKIKFIAISILSFPIIIWGAIEMGSGVFERTTATIEKGVLGERQQLWLDAWHEFTTHILFGGRIEIGFYPHNFILETLMATGIIGFLLLMIVLVIAFKKIIKYAFIDKAYIWVFIVFMQGIAQHSFSGAIYSAILIFFPLGLIFSNYSNNEQ